MILLIANNKEIMGEKTNSPVLNILGGLTAPIMGIMSIFFDRNTSYKINGEYKKTESIILLRNSTLKKKRLAREIEAQSTDPSFWQDQKNASAKMKELSDLHKEIEDISVLSTLVSEGKHEEAEKLLDKLEVFAYLSKPYDEKNAILSIHSGQGGVEAMDWAQMLFRMYSRYFEKRMEI